VKEILEAESCQDGIRLLQEEVDILILDIRLNDGTGFDVLEHLNEKAISTIPVIFTSFPYPQHKKKAVEMGAKYFIDKSNSDDLLDLVEKLAKENFDKGGTPSVSSQHEPKRKDHV
jgi:response regulator RpfG family c-di-GMP phosphodiesterase